VNLLVREVRYEPVLCRLGLHRWACAVKSADDFLRRWFLCADLDVHVHECRRCGRTKIVGRMPVSRFAKREMAALPAPAEHVLRLPASPATRLLEAHVEAIGELRGHWAGPARRPNRERARQRMIERNRRGPFELGKPEPTSIPGPGDRRR